MESFKDLADELLAFEWESHPAEATGQGIHNYDHLLGDYSEERLAEINGKQREFIRRLEAIPAEELPLDERIDRSILIGQLSAQTTKYDQFNSYQKDPGIYPEIGLEGIYLLSVRHFAPLAQRAQSILSRLGQIPQLLENGKANLKRVPPVFVQVAIEVCESGREFFHSLIPQIAQQVPSLKGKLLEANQEVLEELKDYQNFLQKGLPEGDFAYGLDLFDYVLRVQHHLPYDSKDLWEMGEEVLAKTREEMEKLAKQIDPFRSWMSIVEKLKEDHPQPEELIDAYREKMEEARNFVIDRDLVTIPQGESLDITLTPVFQRSTLPYAAYMPPPPFEKEQKGFFYVTPVDDSIPSRQREEQLRGHNRFGLVLTALHEAYPGHHLQLVHSNRVKSRLRKTFFTSSFAEGWALYCEELMYEEGFYTDPRVRLMQLKDQLWRATRVLIDVGLHTRGWSFEKGVGFLVDNAKLEKTNAEKEVKRYCSTPTQPMSYLVGKAQIMDLRRELRLAEGKRSKLKEFHDLLLSFGTIPVALVREGIFEDKK